ncbi:hypothetical protein CQA49_03195 [Helicobacter sp. MIT 00-7814]|uniref:Rieske (2Fe-2S) protein n=1 Tax=unclassified Helicobacter TaxID=2593540 RepID=UPI000E1E7211|nr:MULTISPECIES: Rieske (2Fe-2S) protein [unclassified Helicobacter]RDU55482.1 hypothetical protein CQA37_03615 [Helicobacter sp. MIT 99-10781]RDU55571.1 hypothetical protein CQA49_03195 [Helicobacter sp. MIT 00-7814]
MKLANIKDLKEGINEINLHKDKFFVYKNKEVIKVYDSICPHQGARLHTDGGEIYCKVHNWRFNKSGESSNIQNASLSEYPHKIDKNGDIYIYIYQTSQSKTIPQMYLKAI